MKRNIKFIGNKTYIRPPKYEEIVYINKLWSDIDTTGEIGGPYYLLEEKALLSFGFEHDQSITECYLLKMTRKSSIRLNCKTELLFDMRKQRGGIHKNILGIIEVTD